MSRSNKTPTAQLAGFLVKYDPAVASIARAAIARLRKGLPGVTEMVYDNYNALAVGFGPSDKASEAIFSIVAYPRWVSVFFLQGARLEDPAKLLKGNGSRVRHIVLNAAAGGGCGCARMHESLTIAKKIPLGLLSERSKYDSRELSLWRCEI